MSFIFANPRKQGQRGQTGGASVEYVRSAPSLVFVNVVVSVATTLYSLLLGKFGWVMEAMFYRTEGGVRFGRGLNWSRVDIGMSDVWGSSLPSLAIRFSGSPTVDVEEEIENAGGTVTKIPGTNKDTYLVPRPTYDLYRYLSHLPHLQTFKAPAGHISPMTIGPLSRLITGIYATARLLRMLSVTSIPIEFEEHYPTLIRPEETRDRPESRMESARGEDEEMEEGEEREEAIRFEKAPAGLLDSFKVMGSFRAATTKLFVTVDEIPTTSYGITLPYIDKASAPDPHVLNLFLHEFNEAFFDDEDDEVNGGDSLVTSWVDEIMNTEQGHWLAHMMSSLLVARRAGTFCQFVIRGERYEGAVMFGQVGIRVVGGQIVRATSGPDFRHELEVFSSHDRALDRIIALASLEAEEQDVAREAPSLRALLAVVAGGGRLPGAVQNEVAKELPKLSFPQRPTPVNEDSVIQTITLLTSDAPIPETEYMHPEQAFVQTRTELVLSRYGPTVPTFSFDGPVRIRCTPSVAKGVGLELGYSPTAPQVFQSRRTPFMQAVRQWNIAMQTGTLLTEPRRKFPGCRVYNKAESQRVWKTLGDMFEKTIVRKGAEPAASGGGSEKRGREGPAGSGVVEPAEKRRRVFL